MTIQKTRNIILGVVQASTEVYKFRVWNLCAQRSKYISFRPLDPKPQAPNPEACKGMKKWKRT